VFWSCFYLQPQWTLPFFQGSNVAISSPLPFFLKVFLILLPSSAVYLQALVCWFFHFCRFFAPRGFCPPFSPHRLPTPADPATAPQHSHWRFVRCLWHLPLGFLVNSRPFLVGPIVPPVFPHFPLFFHAAVSPSLLYSPLLTRLVLTISGFPQVSPPLPLFIRSPLLPPPIPRFAESFHPPMLPPWVLLQLTPISPLPPATYCVSLSPLARRSLLVYFEEPFLYFSPSPWFLVFTVPFFFFSFM